MLKPEKLDIIQTTDIKPGATLPNSASSRGTLPSDLSAVTVSCLLSWIVGIAGLPVCLPEVRNSF